VLYNAGYYSPLGGATAGPRLLIPLLPFLALALAPVVRALPVTTLALAVASTVELLAAHLTQPLISPPYDTGDWWHWVATGHFTQTILAPGRNSPLAALPIVVAAAAALVAGAVSLGRPARLDVLPAAVAVPAWWVARESFPHLGRSHLGALAVAACLAAVVLACRRRTAAALGVATVAGVLVVHRHAAQAAAVASAALMLQLAALARDRRARG